MQTAQPPAACQHTQGEREGGKQTPRRLPTASKSSPSTQTASPLRARDPAALPPRTNSTAPHQKNTVTTHSRATPEPSTVPPHPQHLLPEQFAAHPAPEPGARVRGSLPLGLLHAALGPLLAPGAGAALRLYQHLRHRGHRFGSGQATRGWPGQPAAGLAQHPHPFCRRGEVRPGEPCWGGEAASGQGSSSGCEPGCRGSPKILPPPARK